MKFGKLTYCNVTVLTVLYVSSVTVRTVVSLNRFIAVIESSSIVINHNHLCLSIS